MKYKFQRSHPYGIMFAMSLPIATKMAFLQNFECALYYLCYKTFML